eukprot:6846854-Prymnesium_polylepis.1
MPRAPFDPSHAVQDYCSIPQRNANLQLASIASLPVYASMSRYFIIIAPRTVHCDSKRLCDSNTYQRRGWCRLEQWAHLSGKGIGYMYVYDHQRLELVEDEHWLRDSIKVMEGDFTVESDREKLVDSCLGLWSIALRDHHSVGINCDIFRLVQENKEQVFPELFFGNMVKMLEDERLKESIALKFALRLRGASHSQHMRRNLIGGELSDIEKLKMAAQRIQRQFRLVKRLRGR